MQGLLLVDKPQGYTSFDVVAKLRGITGTRRIGHTGTLDPMATGVLPVLLGRATRLADILACTDKAYRAQMRFGILTDTLDIWGKVLKEDKTAFTLEEIRPVAARFSGEISQTPPMFSAVRQHGKRLYELARKGLEIDRRPRTVRIHELKVISFEEQTQTLTLDVCCSKGTYIRSLCADIGKALGSCAALTALRRTMACGFIQEQCAPLDILEKEGVSAYLLPPSDAVEGYPAVQVSSAQAKRFLNGGALLIDRLTIPEDTAPFYRIYEQDVFLGVARRDDAGNQLRVQCLMK